MILTSISGRTIALGMAAVIVAAVAPLRAEDRDGVYAALYQSLRVQERFAAPEARVAPRVPRSSLSPYVLDRRFPRRPPRTVREKKRDIKEIKTAKPVPKTVKPAPKEAKPVPKEARKPAQIPANPHLALMTDPTLRPGDIVIFPDGPRVFQGEPGNRHALADFVAFTKAKGLTKADRKYLTALRTGINDAWVEASDATKSP